MTPRFNELFVCGMSRSGTTLLSTIFDSHPDISMGYELMPVDVPPAKALAALLASAVEAIGDDARAVARHLIELGEATVGAFIRRCARSGVSPDEVVDIVMECEREGIRGFDTLTARAIVARKVIERKRVREGASVAGFKCNSSNIAEFSSVFPNGRFVYVVRDPRDVVASHFANDFERTLQQVVKAWNVYTKRFGEFVTESPERARVVQYEDLVAEPAAVLEPMFSWLGLPYLESLLRFFDSKASIHDSGHVEKENVGRNFYVTSLDRWVVELAHKQVREVEVGCWESMGVYGYDLAPPDRTVPLNEKLKSKKRISFRAKKRYYRDQYRKLLEPFARDHVNVTWHEAAVERHAAGEPILLIRHDVDHDLETAVRAARWEHDNGFRATYCILHTAWYYSQAVDGRSVRTTDLVEACLEIQNLGHEVNLHNNAVALALEEGLDPLRLLQQELRFLRSRGVRVTGSSSHGHALCRELGFFNLELFAETVWESKGGRRTVGLDDHQIELGRIPMGKLGLLYEGYDLPRDVYVTDSGGNLRVRRNTRGRGGLRRSQQGVDVPYPRVVGVLTHPIWWDFERDSPEGAGFDPLEDLAK